MARNKELNEKMKEERKDEILSNALKLFSIKGLTGTKIIDISSATGFSQGLIYHYYKSKEEIFTDLIRTAFQKLNDACRYLEKLEKNPLEKLEMAIDGLIRGIDKNEDSAMYHLLVAQATMSDAIPEEAKKIIIKENKIPYKIISKIISAGQLDGSIKKFDADEMALVFWTSIKGLAINKAINGKKFKAPNIKILMNLFVNN